MKLERYLAIKVIESCSGNENMRECVSTCLDHIRSDYGPEIMHRVADLLQNLYGLRF